jgi:hypothetical protein
LVQTSPFYVFAICSIALLYSIVQAWKGSL